MDETAKVTFSVVESVVVESIDVDDVCNCVDNAVDVVAVVVRVVVGATVKVVADVDDVVVVNVDDVDVVVVVGLVVVVVVVDVLGGLL